MVVHILKNEKQIISIYFSFNGLFFSGVVSVWLVVFVWPMVV